LDNGKVIKAMKDKPNLALAGFAVAMFVLMLLFATMWEAESRRTSQPQTMVDTIMGVNPITDTIPNKPNENRLIGNQRINDY
jgi:hypothetical protein